MKYFVIFALTRGVAQPGRASALGAECRQFESGYPDTKNATPLGVAFCIVIYYEFELISSTKTIESEANSDGFRP